MRFIIEYEGPVCDVAAGWFAAHQAAAADVGWSRLDQPTFWRITRTKGLSDEILPGAREAKLAEYRTRFAAHLESRATILMHEPPDGLREVLSGLVRLGPSSLITLGTNVADRLDLLEKHQLRRLFAQSAPLSPDPRSRPGELKTLSQSDRRTIAVGGTDAIVRSAEEAGLFTVGVSRGTCSQNRLHAAGARVVYRDLGELLGSLRSGAGDLIKAGLLPAPLG